MINFKAKRFEYYDSMGGGEEDILANLRRWLEDEHANKKGGAPYDTSAWMMIAWKKRTPQQPVGPYSSRETPTPTPKLQ